MMNFLSPRFCKNPQADPDLCLHAGFTLIEVLVTIVILSVCLISILSVFERHLMALGASRECLWSGLLINEKMAEMDGYARERDESKLAFSRGSFSGPYAGFRWETDVSNVPLPSEHGEHPYSLKEVTVTVWRESTDNKYSATTYLWLGGDLETK